MRLSSMVLISLLIVLSLQTPMSSGGCTQEGKMSEFSGQKIKETGLKPHTILCMFRWLFDWCTPLQSFCQVMHTFLKDSIFKICLSRRSLLGDIFGTILDVLFRYMRLVPQNDQQLHLNLIECVVCFQKSIIYHWWMDDLRKSAETHMRKVSKKNISQKPRIRFKNSIISGSMVDSKKIPNPSGHYTSSRTNGEYPFGIHYISQPIIGPTLLDELWGCHQCELVGL